MKLFGTDGIRGVVGEWPLIPEFFLKLGQAAGHVLGEENNTTFIIGRDTRQSGVMLQDALTAGLLGSGINIFDIGVIPTSAVSWLVPQIKADVGLVISASHNPVQENGIKFFGRLGQKLSEIDEEKIEYLLFDDGFQPGPKTNLGRYIDGRAFSELYFQDLLKEHPVNFLTGLTIIVDCAHGAASYVAPSIFQRAGANVVAINASPTGMNINFNAGSEHVRRSPQKFKDIIAQYKANFGLAFDGDADRVVFIDEEGTLIDGDHMLVFLARYLDKRGVLLNRSVVTTTMRNEGLKRLIESLNLEIHETPVGDKYVVDKLIQIRDTGINKGKIGLGGEQAGHIILLDEEHVTGDGIRTALFVLNAYIESGNKTLAEFATGIGKTPQIIASAFVGHGDRLDKQELQSMENDLLTKHAGLLRANLRYSGTEPLFRIMLEADTSQTEEYLAAIASEIANKIQKIAKHPGAPLDILNCTRGGLIEIKSK